MIPIKLYIGLFRTIIFFRKDPIRTKAAKVLAPFCSIILPRIIAFHTLRYACINDTIGRADCKEIGPHSG
jgi:hypothetical protein